jgi:hypothetical protein
MARVSDSDKLKECELGFCLCSVRAIITAGKNYCINNQIAYEIVSAFLDKAKLQPTCHNCHQVTWGDRLAPAEVREYAYNKIFHVKIAKPRCVRTHIENSERLSTKKRVPKTHTSEIVIPHIPSPQHSTSITTTQSKTSIINPAPSPQKNTTTAASPISSCAVHPIQSVVPCLVTVPTLDGYDLKSNKPCNNNTPSFTNYMFNSNKNLLDVFDCKNGLVSSPSSYSSASSNNKCTSLYPQIQQQTITEGEGDQSDPEV